MTKVTIFSWNMQGSGENLVLKLANLFSMYREQNTHCIFCLQECGSAAAYSNLNSRFLAVSYDTPRETEKSIYFTATLTYFPKDNLYGGNPLVLYGLFAWNKSDKNKRCGTAILSTLPPWNCYCINIDLDSENAAKRPVVGLSFGNYVVFSMHANASYLSRKQVEITAANLLVGRNETVILAGDFNHSPLYYGNPYVDHIIFISPCMVYFPNSRTQGIVENQSPYRIRQLDYFMSNKPLNSARVSSYRTFEYGQLNFGEETTDDMGRTPTLDDTYENLFDDNLSDAECRAIEKKLKLCSKNGENFFQLSDHDIVKLEFYI